jgi:hypothetical protein
VHLCARAKANKGRWLGRQKTRKLLAQFGDIHHISSQMAIRRKQQIQASPLLDPFSSKSQQNSSNSFLPSASAFASQSSHVLSFILLLLLLNISSSSGLLTFPSSMGTNQWWQLLSLLSVCNSRAREGSS